MDGWMSLIFFEKRKRSGLLLGRVLHSCAKKHGVKRLRDNLNLKLKGIRGDHCRA